MCEFVCTRTRDKGPRRGMLPCISDDVPVSPHICRYLQTRLAVNHRVSPCSLAPGSLADRWTILMALVFFFLFFFLPSCVASRGLCHPIHTLKAAKKTPSLPSQCVNPSPDSVCRGFQETKHFLYCWSRCYWPVRKWSFMALTAAWQGCLLCTGVDWSCNLVARYWADIYDNLSAQTGRISARNERNKSVCWRIRYSALWLGRWTALFGAQLSCVGDMSFFFFIRVNYT